MFKIALWISLVLMVASLVVIAPLMNPAMAGELSGQQIDSAANQQAVKDEIIATRIDAAYLRDRRLKPYYIEVRVDHGVVSLKGTVGSQADRELALFIASEQQYVQEVRDQIEVREAGLVQTGAVVMDTGGAVHAAATDEAASEAEAGQPEPGTEEQGGLGAMLRDASTTAKVKTRLLVHFGLTGLSINVDASNQVVRLTGTVEDPELVSLVGQVAATTPGVQMVRNELRVEPATASA